LQEWTRTEGMMPVVWLKKTPIGWLRRPHIRWLRMMKVMKKMRGSHREETKKRRRQCSILLLDKGRDRMSNPSRTWELRKLRNLRNLRK